MGCEMSLILLPTGNSWNIAECGVKQKTNKNLIIDASVFFRALSAGHRNPSLPGGTGTWPPQWNCVRQTGTCRGWLYPRSVKVLPLGDILESTVTPL